MAVTEPILLMGFNRPECMAASLARLREVQPRTLFIAIDGPRPHRPEEIELVTACRALVSEVDWDCNVQTLFQPHNLGCGLGVSTAISWFFEHVDRGIILEDDIIPDPTFFDFCAQLLTRYENDDRVFAISGCNYVPSGHLTAPQAPYRFSRVPHIWGWATWRRSWQRHRLQIPDWRSRVPLGQLWRITDHSPAGTAYWASTFTLLGRGDIDTWDGQLVLAAFESGQLTATSNVNLVQNIGFGQSATHTIVDRDELQPIGHAHMPLPDVPVVVDQRADTWTLRHHHKGTWRGLWEQGGRYVTGRLRRSS